MVYGMTGIVGVLDEFEKNDADGEAGTVSDDLGLIMTGITTETIGKTVHFPLMYPNPTSQTH